MKYPGQMPFLYACNKKYPTELMTTWIVKIAYFDYVGASRIIEFKNLSEPAFDEEINSFEFNSEEESLKFIAKWWKENTKEF